MQTRKSIAAGPFYPGQQVGCTAEIEQCLKEHPVPEELPETIAGGIVPHAGWVFSGSLAGMVFLAIKQRYENVDTFIVFGAAHGYNGQEPAVYDKGSWNTPLGDIVIDEDLAEAVLDSDRAVSDIEAHRFEYSIEVQVPFIQHLFPQAKLVPIIVPPSEQAIPLGESIGEIISGQDKKIVFIGSTDLTHYGPRYGFTPMGTGPDAIEWASKVNDKKFIDSAVKLEPKIIMSDARQHQNACGPGAAAASIAAAKKLSRTNGKLLAYTNSNEVMQKKMGSSSAESVGYAAIVF